MKRMKKKVVAMVTLAMFVLSMVPMAAFAAPASTPVDANKTLTADKTASHSSPVTVTVASDAAVEDADVWVEDTEGNIVREGVTFASLTSSTGDVYEVQNGVATGVEFAKANNTTFTVTFTNPGKYVVKASYMAKDKYTPGQDAGKPVFTLFTATDVIDVVVPVSNLTVNGKNNGAGGDTKVAVEVANDTLGTTHRTPVVVKLTSTANVPKDTKIAVDAASLVGTGLKLVDVKGQEIGAEVPVVVSTTTATAEMFVMGAKGVVPGFYPVSVAFGDKKVNFDIQVLDKAAAPTDMVAATIEGVPVTATVVKDDIDTALKVQFAVKNAAGEKIDVTDSEPMVKDITEEVNSVDVVKYAQADALKVTGPVKVDAADLTFKYDTDSKNMVLAAKNAASKNLSAIFTENGKYTVTATLKNGQTATVEFVVGTYDAQSVVGIEIVPVEKTGNKIIVHEVADPQGVKSVATQTAAGFHVYTVDKNGMKNLVDADVKFATSPKLADKLTVDAKLADKTEGTVTKGDGTVSVTGNAGVALNDVLGTEVVVTAIYTPVAGKTMMAESTFVLAPVPASTSVADNALTFDKTEGVVLNYNEVNPQIVNTKKPDVKAEAVDQVLVAKVLSSSNKDAKATVKVVGQKLSIYSDKDTVLEVQVLVEKSGYLYAETLTYTVGKKEVAPEAGKTLIALTIGSKDMIVNNEVVKLDAAPFVNKDYRTMVPLTAITEAFGVTPEWNEADRTVTVEMNGVKIVMTIDKQAYTVNGKEAKMDTAPVIVNSRTMVPVRFVAEELGFNVAPIMSDKGLTEGVVISK